MCRSAKKHQTYRVDEVIDPYNAHAAIIRRGGVLLRPILEIAELTKHGQSRALPLRCLIIALFC